MNPLERKPTTAKNRFFFITDMKNTKSELSYVKKTDILAIVETGLKSVRKKLSFLKIAPAVPISRSCVTLELKQAVDSLRSL